LVHPHPGPLPSRERGDFLGGERDFLGEEGDFLGEEGGFFGKIDSSLPWSFPMKRMSRIVAEHFMRSLSTNENEATA